jgi:hypothetical protein
MRARVQASHIVTRHVIRLMRHISRRQMGHISRWRSGEILNRRLRQVVTIAREVAHSDGGEVVIVERAQGEIITFAEVHCQVMHATGIETDTVETAALITKEAEGAGWIICWLAAEAALEHVRIEAASDEEHAHDRAEHHDRPPKEQASQNQRRRAVILVNLIYKHNNEAGSNRASILSVAATV